MAWTVAVQFDGTNDTNLRGVMDIVWSHGNPHPYMPLGLDTSGKAIVRVYDIGRIYNPDDWKAPGTPNLGNKFTITGPDGVWFTGYLSEIRPSARLDRVNIVTFHADGPLVRLSQKNESVFLRPEDILAVSYTHLTLPTNREV